MRRNLIILMAVAVCFAGLVFTFVRQKVAPDMNQTTIMVAKTDLSAGTKLTGSEVMWLPVEKSAVPPAAIIRGKAFKDLSDLAGRRLRRAVFKGEPVLSSTLVNDGDTYLAGALDPGMRAIAIPVSAQSAVGGFIQPGNMVDVILTYDVKLPNSTSSGNPSSLIVANSASETVLSNVRVLAVDQEIKDLGKDAKPARTVTIQVKPSDAETISLAQQMGDLSLSLRSISSEAEEAPKGFTSDVQRFRALKAAVRANSIAQAEANGMAAPIMPSMPSESPQQSAPQPMPNQGSDSTITVYNGGQVSKLRVQGGLH